MLLKRLGPTLCLALAGCAALKSSVKNGGGPADRPQAEAREAVGDLAADFEAGHAEPFFERFDDGNFPNWENFRYDCRQFMLNNRDITLDVVVDSVVSDAEEISVQAHWNRRYVYPSGMSKLDEGSCELIFRRQAARLLLANVDGDNPFL